MELKPGESRVVEFTVTTDKLAYFDRGMNYGVELGTFTVMAGGSYFDKDLKKVKIEVL